MYVIHIYIWKERDTYITESFCLKQCRSIALYIAFTYVAFYNLIAFYTCSFAEIS